MKSRSMLAAAALLATALAPAARADIHSFQLAVSSPQDGEYHLTVTSQVPPGRVATLPGFAIRLCWESEQLQPDFAQSTFAADPTNAAEYFWKGLQSLQACDTHPNSLGVPLVWLDEATGWPATETLEVASLKFVTASSRFDSARFWVEEVALGPDMTLGSNETRAQGVLVFHDGLE